MRSMTCALALLAACALARPAAAKDPEFWNQTSHEFTSVRLAAAGTTQWGAEQTDNDPDHAVSADERLRISGVAPGSYDVRLADKAGRVCIVHSVTVKSGGRLAFSIDEKQLTDCKP